MHNTCGFGYSNISVLRCTSPLYFLFFALYLWNSIKVRVRGNLTSCFLSTRTLLLRAVARSCEQSDVNDRATGVTRNRKLKHEKKILSLYWNKACLSRKRNKHSLLQKLRSPKSVCGLLATEMWTANRNIMLLYQRNSKQCVAGGNIYYHHLSTWNFGNYPCMKIDSEIRKCFLFSTYSNILV